MHSELLAEPWLDGVSCRTQAPQPCTGLQSHQDQAAAGKGNVTCAPRPASPVADGGGEAASGGDAGGFAGAAERPSLDEGLPGRPAPRGEALPPPRGRLRAVIGLRPGAASGEESESESRAATMSPSSVSGSSTSQQLS